MKLGIDMGGMSIKMGLVNEENEIIGRITNSNRSDGAVSDAGGAHGRCRTADA